MHYHIMNTVTLWFIYATCTTDSPDRSVLALNQWMIAVPVQNGKKKIIQ